MIKKNTWLLVDKKFLLLCSTRHLISEEIFQVHGENRPVANLLVADFRSQPVCSIFRKEGERKNNKVTVLLSFLSYQNHEIKVVMMCIVVLDFG